MIRCAICKKVTRPNAPTGKYKLWSWIMEDGKKVGKRIISEERTCMKHNREVLLK